jgi:hypothetical protein
MSTLSLAFSCTTDQQQKFPSAQNAIEKEEDVKIEDWLKQQTIDTSIRQHLVFAITPNDCINCTVAFGSLLRHIAMQRGKSKLYAVHVILPRLRKIERPEVMRTVFKDVDTTQLSITWNTKLFEQAISKIKTGKVLSALLIYTNAGELTYAHYGKTLTGTEPELLDFLH